MFWRHQKRTDRALIDERLVEVAFHGFCTVGMLVAVDQAGGFWHHIENAVEERRLQIAVLAGHGDRVVRGKIFGVEAEYPIEKHFQSGILLEKSTEHLGSALAHERHKLIPFRIGVEPGILPLAEIILEVAGNALHSRLARKPAENRHRVGEIRPSGIVLPVKALARRAETDEKRFGKLRHLKYLPENGNLGFERLAFPLVAHRDELEFFSGAVGRTEVNADAVDSGVTELVGIVEDILRGKPFVLPAKRNVLLFGHGLDGSQTVDRNQCAEHNRKNILVHSFLLPFVGNLTPSQSGTAT